MTNTYKKGDKFKFEKPFKGGWATTDDPKDWSDGGYIENNKKYEIHKITSTQVYFDYDENNTGNWYIMKKKDFDLIAVFDNTVVVETSKTKTIIGYVFNEQFAEFKPAALKLATVSNFDLDGSNFHFAKESLVADYLERAQVLDKWFTPVYEEDFKIGDWVVFQFDKALPQYKTSVWNQNMTLQISAIEVGGKSLRFDGQHPRGGTTQIGNHVSCFRKATAKEIEEATTKRINNIGSKNATLILEKDGNTIKILGKTERLNLNTLISVYNTLCRQSIGGFNIEPYSKTERLFRVGCEGEDNRVSLQEIKTVIDKFKK